MDGSDFQKNKPQRRIIGIKNEKNELKTYFQDHIRTWTVTSEKKEKSSPRFLVFQKSARGPRLLQFSKSSPSCEKLAHPCITIIAQYKFLISRSEICYVPVTDTENHQNSDGFGRRFCIENSKIAGRKCQNQSKLSLRTLFYITSDLYAFVSKLCKRTKNNTGDYVN